MKKNKVKLIERLLFIVVLVIGLIVLFKPVFKNVNYGLDLQGGFEVLYKVEGLDGEEVTKEMLKNTYKSILKRIDVVGVSEPNVVIEGNDKIRVQLAGVTNPDKARETISVAGNLTFRDTSDNVLMNSSVLKSAKIGTNSRGLPAVALNIKDADTFYRVTKDLSEKSDNNIVIWFDYGKEDSFTKEQYRCGTEASNCLSIAGVSQGFTDDVIIEGKFTQAEVEYLVDMINAGSLPTKLTEISSKTVSAAFGENSKNQTLIAGVVGIALIMAFMIVLYKFSGFIASIGILIYTFLVFLVFWAIGGVLTLPGIAALVIGIGMAVDSTIISFSRIKEELANKMTLQDSFKLGNQNSFRTILDSNLTTAFAAIILFILGESSVKGFATMLIISIFVTLIVMVYVIRYLQKMFIDTKMFNKNLYFFIGYKKPKKKRNNFNFVKVSKYISVSVLLIIIIGIVTIATKGLKLGIDFKGGSSITIQTNKKITEKTLEKDIKNFDYTMYEIEKQDDETYVLKIEETLEKEEIMKLEKHFSNEYEAKTDIGVISNIVKEELIKNTFISLVAATLMIVVYVSFRFKFSYALGGIIALVHDALMMVVFFSVFNLEVSTIFVAAVLSIVGYSINDTIVIFDRIRENLNKLYKNKITEKKQLEEVVNISIKETLGRSINTTITTMIAVISLIVLGSNEIINFNIALLVGLFCGTISSLFIAPYLWLQIEKKNIGKPKKKKWYEEDEVEELKVKGINS